jgi:beta-galactosidase
VSSEGRTQHERAERLWKRVTLNDYFAGNFMWTGIDYLGESTWPFKGFASGAMDITGAPKDMYYLSQSLWTDRPVRVQVVRGAEYDAVPPADRK